MYRIDHLAFRTRNRFETAKFFTDALKYRLQTEFEIKFEDGTTANCLALEPSDVSSGLSIDWTITMPGMTDYHRPPECFISDGPPDSIVGRWVKERNGIGGLHHIAIQCDSVIDTMNEWKEKGYAEFATDYPLSCDNIIQCFSKPSVVTGVIFELIQRGKHGFCKENVKDLMSSTSGL